VAISGTVSGNFDITDTRTNVGLPAASTRLGINRQPSITYSDGAAAAMFDRIYAAARTLGGASEDLDLAGVLADVYGGTITAVRAKALYIKNLSTANNIVVGGDATNPWATLLNATGTITLPPGAWMIVATPDATGWAITAGTGDILQVAGTSGQSYEIGIGLATS
jgi:hypothetical protein